MRERVPTTGHRPGNTAKETGARVRRMGAEGSGSRQPSPQGTSGSGYFTDVFGHTGPSPGGTASSGGWWLQGVARAWSSRGPTVQGPAHLSSVSVSANRYAAPKFIRHLGLNDDLSSAPARDSKRRSPQSTDRPGKIGDGRSLHAEHTPAPWAPRCGVTDRCPPLPSPGLGSATQSSEETISTPRNTTVCCPFPVF